MKNNQILIDSLHQKGIRNPYVLQAMYDTERSAFVPDAERGNAYQDHPLPIGFEQTISQPYIVAYMTEILLGSKQKLDSVLEIGTGSGYQAAILAKLANHVYTIERIKPLYESAVTRFRELGLDNVHCLYADGSQGWLEHSPYDAIIVTSAAHTIPKALCEQLAMQGRLVIPLSGKVGQQLYLIKHTTNGFEQIPLQAVRFVPLLKGTDE